jgi:xanthine dehydrogenase small subunit
LIRFLLDSVEHSVEQLRPDMTLLDYLREQAALAGTKEGCASGDCGACTVAVAAPAGEELEYQTINACITPLGNIHGRQVLTSQHLAEQGQLHPVQQAMVDCHGSQCGFCTPGIVMSLFAHHKNHPAPKREQLLESLGGNLCRCTGYRPIIEAGVQMYDGAAAADKFEESATATCEALAEIEADEAGITLAQESRQYLAPRSLDELAKVLQAQPGARLVAGATDLFLEVTQGLARIDTLVYTGQVPELSRVSKTDTGLAFGAAVSFTQAQGLLCKYWPQLQELIERIGSLQIRNQGTLGGNIANASPIGDMPPVLLALDARLVLRLGSVTRELPLAEFFLSYRVTALQQGEFIERIIVPVPSAGACFRAWKISKRFEDDISAVCGAFNLQLDDGIIQSARVAFGGMAEIPRRAPLCEAALTGQPWSEQTIAAAQAALQQDFTPIDDFRASAHYRMTVAQNLLLRCYLAGSMNAASLQVNHYA